MANLQIATVGLDDHDSALLAQQLRTLRNRTHHGWVIGREVKNADLLISTIPVSSELSGVLAMPAGVAGRTPDILLEWPLRLFSLLDALLFVEARLSPHRERPSTSLATRLVELTTDSLCNVEPPLFISPDRKACWSELDGIVAIAEQLLALPEGDFVPAGDRVIPTGHQRSLSGLIWSLALREGIASEYTWHPETTHFRLATWPSFGVWESQPSWLRLAALYCRENASLRQGAAVSGLPIDQVSAFLQACALCELGLTTTTVSLPVERTVPVRSSLLSRLRLKLGL